MPEFDMPKLVYFALSVFWRGAVRNWTIEGETPLDQVDLGKYLEAIRLFLLDRQRLPREVCVFVHVWPYLRRFLGVWFPRRMKTDAGMQYNFMMNGLGFALCYGSDLPPLSSELDSHHSVNKLVHVNKRFADTILSSIKDALAQTDMTGLERMNAEIKRLRSSGSIAD